jgi:plasmid stabilization system protein ParE
MAWTYILLPKAQIEYEDSVIWYLTRSLSAAENFIISIEEALDLICSHPTRWKNTYENFRELG